MRSSRHTFKILAKTLSLLATTLGILALVSLLLGDDLVLPWHTIPTYVKAPLSINYFELNGVPFGILADQVLIWQHFSTGDYEYLAWLDYLVFGLFFISLLVISVTLTYLARSGYLFCTALMLLMLMQLNLSELGFLPDYVAYLCLLVFIGTTYFFQSIKTGASLAQRSLGILIIYGLFSILIGCLCPTVAPVSATVAFGLFAPLMLVVLTMIFAGGDTIHILFTITTQNSPKGKSSFHFISIGLLYILLLLLLFLEQTGQLSIDLWGIHPYPLFIIGLLCGHLSLPAKMKASTADLPVALIKGWLFPGLAALSPGLIAYAELSGNDSLSQALQMCILVTQLAGAVVFYLYALLNFILMPPGNEKIPNFFVPARVPLFTARVSQLIFILSLFFYLDIQPCYQAQAARYVALGALSESADSDLPAAQYYKQAGFYDYYGFKANYALSRLAKKQKRGSEVIECLKRATWGDPGQKAVIALANFYSEQGQLFSKLLSLKQAGQSSYRLSNNLGIAHFEFAQYDSSLMAFDRSLALKQNPASFANRLALSYYAPLPDFPNSVNEGEMEIRTRVNAQAIANKKGEPATYTAELKADTLLTQEELYELYNHGLNRNQTNREKVLAACDYYLSNPRNTGLKEFLLLAQSIQYYEAGQVNRAFESMAELPVAAPENRVRYAFTAGLRAAQQGAYTLAQEYFDRAIAGNYRTAEITALKAAIKAKTLPALPMQKFANIPANPTKVQLKTLAGQNAFDVALTLEAISRLRKKGAQNATLYELLRQAITINRYNLKLMEAYADQSIKSGLAAFGRTGLLSLRGKVPDKALDKALANFEQLLNARRNSMEVLSDEVSPCQSNANPKDSLRRSTGLPGRVPWTFGAEWDFWRAIVAVLNFRAMKP